MVAIGGLLTSKSREDRVMGFVALGKERTRGSAWGKRSRDRLLFDDVIGVRLARKERWATKLIG